MKYTDLDFFEPERKRVILRFRKNIRQSIPAVVLIIVLVNFISLSIGEKLLSNELEDLLQQNENIQLEISQGEEDIDNLKNSIESIQEATTDLKNSDISGVTPVSEVTEHQLLAIKQSTPVEAFYSNILIQENVLMLEGYAKTTQVVAKIVYNLEQTEYYKNVYVDNIAISQDNENSYFFTIYASIKE